jgi:hypothetical protein
VHVASQLQHYAIAGTGRLDFMNRDTTATNTNATPASALGHASARRRMRPLAEFPAVARAAVRVLLTDIDDTITEHGLLPAASLAALERLSAAGIKVIPVTGRPAGWCDHIARMWPVDAVVGENGALYFYYDRKARKMHQVYSKTAAERAEDQNRLAALREKVLREIPGVGIASDQDYRVADLAFDFCEDVPPIPMEDVHRMVAILKAGGAQAKISSIHVNTWFGGYDKMTMSRRCLDEVFGIDMDKENDRLAFAGDSPNDGPMFAFFHNSVGVANVRNFELVDEPTWVTELPGARGFVELAEALLSARGVCQHE